MAVVFGLIRVSNAISRDLDVHVGRPAGISTAGFNLLFALYVWGAQIPRRLAGLASVSPPSMSSLVNTLERAGLVRRSPSSEDRRSVLVELTKTGRSLCEDLIPKTHARAVGWSDRLDGEERRVLAALLGKLLSDRP